jgi:hypothetical protein
VNVTASIGLSRYPVDGTSSEALISRSDMAMYRVKGSGGNAFDYSAQTTSRTKKIPLASCLGMVPGMYTPQDLIPVLFVEFWLDFLR